MAIIIRESIERRVYAFNERIRRARSEEVARQLMVDRNRWLCRNDLYYLACVTGNDKIERWGDFYRPFCDEVSLLNWRVVDLGLCKFYDRDEFGQEVGSGDLRAPLGVEEVTDDWRGDLGFYRRLYLCYRAFYKTTIVTKLGGLQLLLNFNNIHFVLAHNRQQNSSDNLVSIKNYFLMSRVGRLFPEYRVKGKDWGNQSGFSTAVRTDYGARTEESVEAIGVDTEVTGRHWMLAKKNDLVTEKSVNTEDQIRKTESWNDRFDLGLFDDPQVPLQDYEGTRYHFADLYSKLRGDKRIKLIEVPVVGDLAAFKGGDDSVITHPGRFSREGVNGLLEKDAWVFMCQMMLRPEDPSKKRFLPEMVRYYDEVPEVLVCYLLVDPANERKKRSDYTAMSMVGVGLGGKKYLLDFLRDKVGPDERIDLALGMVKRWEGMGYKVEAIGWEKIGLSNDCHYLKKRMWEEGCLSTLVEITAHMQEKVDRIRDTLVPQYALGEWLWPRGLDYVSSYEGRTVDMVEELRLEFLQFPNGLHDDMLDTQSFLSRMSVFEPMEEEEEEERPMTFGDLMKMREDREILEGADPWARLGVGSRL